MPVGRAEDSDGHFKSLRRLVFWLVIAVTVATALCGYGLSVLLTPEYDSTKALNLWLYGLVYFLVAVASNIVAAGGLFLGGYLILEFYRDFTASKQFKRWIVDPLKEFMVEEVVGRFKSPLEVYARDEVNWAECIQQARTIVICVQGWDWVIEHNESAFRRFFEAGGCVKLILPDEADEEQMGLLQQRLERPFEVQFDEITRTISLLQTLWAEVHKKTGDAQVEVFRLKEKRVIWYCAVKFDNKTLVVSPYDNVRLRESDQGSFYQDPTELVPRRSWGLD